jgi:hypothetical protein
MTEQSQASEQPELKRAIGPKLLLFFVVGDILGTGVYALTGNVAGKIGGAMPATCLAWGNADKCGVTWGNTKGANSAHPLPSAPGHEKVLGQ